MKTTYQSKKVQFANVLEDPENNLLMIITVIY